MDMYRSEDADDKLRDADRRVKALVLLKLALSQEFEVTVLAARHYAS
jgi:hypothetical protein